jgi:hypothetical protein
MRACLQSGTRPRPSLRILSAFGLPATDIIRRQVGDLPYNSRSLRSLHPNPAALGAFPLSLLVVNVSLQLLHPNSAFLAGHQLQHRTLRFLFRIPSRDSDGAVLHRAGATFLLNPERQRGGRHSLGAAQGVRQLNLPNPVELIDGMERALNKLRAANGGPEWRDAVVESSAAVSRGVAGLLETLQTPPKVPAPKVPDEALLRARRYARVRVAEMQLYAADRVAAGRAARHLYTALRPEIDGARIGFTEEFLTSARGIPDYLHEELVRVLAQDDETLLGPDYPGPLA